jgi:hypothetical protein
VEVDMTVWMRDVAATLWLLVFIGSVFEFAGFAQGTLA